MLLWTVDSDPDGSRHVSPGGDPQAVSVSGDPEADTRLEAANDVAVSVYADVIADLVRGWKDHPDYEPSWED